MQTQNKITNWAEKNVDIWGNIVLGIGLGGLFFWILQYNSRIYSML